ncbi:hypothetical protein CBS101457_006528 [Exobasidium rhododendri]|nr:hypothetical protein CBS101457_006528 [Exobasidium rhododendri]
MSSTSLFRVLVTLAVLVSIVMTKANGRPLPTITPYSARRSSSSLATLLSTSRTPPLPAVVLAQEKRETQSHKKLRLDFNSRVELHGQERLSAKKEKRSDTHSHIHEHIHDHNDDRYRFHDYCCGKHRPDWCTQDIIDYHSRHWAEHHGLLHGEHFDHDYNYRQYEHGRSRHYGHDDDHDHDHTHEHIHEHVHGHKRDEMAERGLVGDVVKPLLPTLSFIPGIITISNLLFGDAQTDGLLKKLGGLVLRVEASNSSSSSHQLFSYRLLASEHERSQVYLSPVNESSFGQTPSDSMDKNETDSIVVQMKLPMLNAKGSPMTMCASFNTSLPIALDMQACTDNQTTSSESTEQMDTSQFFIYTPSTGTLDPMLMKVNSDQTTETDANSLTAGPDDDATNTTQPMLASTPSNNDTETAAPLKTILRFVPITSRSTSGKRDDLSASIFLPLTSSLRDGAEDTTTLRGGVVPRAVQSVLERGCKEKHDTHTDKGSLDSPMSDDPDQATLSSDKGLVDDLDGPFSSEVSDSDTAPQKSGKGSMKGSKGPPPPPSKGKGPSKPAKVGDQVPVMSDSNEAATTPSDQADGDVTNEPEDSLPSDAEEPNQSTVVSGTDLVSGSEDPLPTEANVPDDSGVESDDDAAVAAAAANGIEDPPTPDEVNDEALAEGIAGVDDVADAPPEAEEAEPELEPAPEIEEGEAEPEADPEAEPEAEADAEPEEEGEEE